MRARAVSCLLLFVVGLTSSDIALSQKKIKRSPSAQAGKQTQRPRSYVGELERLGKNGQDVLVLGVEAPGFEKLSLQQKRLAYFLYRAAIAGNDIFTDQAHRYALEMKQLLEQIYLHSTGLDAATRHAVHDYLKYIWVSHSQYGPESHVKFLPNYLTYDLLKQAAAP